MFRERFLIGWSSRSAPSNEPWGKSTEFKHFQLFRNDTKEFIKTDLVSTDEWSPDKTPRKSNLRKSILPDLIEENSREKPSLYPAISWIKLIINPFHVTSRSLCQCPRPCPCPTFNPPSSNEFKLEFDERVFCVLGPLSKRYVIQSAKSD